MPRNKVDESENILEFENVGEFERTASLVIGSKLALTALSRIGFGTWALGAVGLGLLLRGITGHCAVYRALDINTNRSPNRELEAAPAKAS